MEEYVDVIGDIKAKDFKNKEAKDVAGIALKELSHHTKHITQLERQRRQENAHPHADGGAATDMGLCTRERMLFYLLVAKVTFSGLLVPLFDIGTDFATAFTHFRFGDISWGALTLFFVWLPGFVCAIAVTVRGLMKKFSPKRLVNYVIVLAVLPILYPLLQILVNMYMLYLMIVNRSREIVSIMGHDVKQFKSLEGFLESAPQFVLQTYILMTEGYKEEDKGEEYAAKRILTLSLSILLSFLSLAKTGYNVNVPDPDDSRKSPQYPENARFFKLTSVFFHLVVTLFRVGSIAYFFACFRGYTMIIVTAAVVFNVGLLFYCEASHTMSLLLGVVSIFMPNGYLLYNFAATFTVDLTYQASKTFITWHMVIINGLFSVCLVLISIWLELDDNWLHRLTSRIEGGPENVLKSSAFRAGMDAGLLVLGVTSLVLAWLHWRISVVPLYQQPVRNGVIEDAQEAFDDEAGTTS